MNTAVAIVIAIALYSFVLQIIPPPFSGILTCCLPLLELPLLWRLTPVSYAVRHAIPIFNPLPESRPSRSDSRCPRFCSASPSVRCDPYRLRSSCRHLI